jgi:heptaprenyl diphosphate synthase
MKAPTGLPGDAITVDRAVALLGAFCLFLSTIEYLIPKPLPFIRIGIANLPLMIALDILPLPSFISLVFIKILGQGIITGSLLSYVFLFSLAGTVISSAAMYVGWKIAAPRFVSFVGIGVIGALTSNITQILCARIFIFGESALYIAPPFLAVGLVTGISLGVLCELFVQRSRWYGDFKK